MSSLYVSLFMNASFLKGIAPTFILYELLIVVRLSISGRPEASQSAGTRDRHDVEPRIQLLLRQRCMPTKIHRELILLLPKLIPGKQPTKVRLFRQLVII